MQTNTQTVLWDDRHIDRQLYINVPLKKLSHPYYPPFWFFYAFQGKFPFERDVFKIKHTKEHFFKKRPAPSSGHTIRTFIYKNLILKYVLLTFTKPTL